MTELAVPRLSQRTLRGTARAAAPEIAAIVLVAAVLWLLRATATIPSIRDTLIFMGFDTERAMLIVALLMGLAAGAIAGAVGTGRLPAAILGIGATAATYAHTFIAQTTRDTNASANLGRLDPGGWLTTLLAIVAAGGLAGLAAGILASEARKAVADLAGQVRAAYRTRRPAAIHRARLAVVITVVAAVLLAVPSMGAMLNYSADVLMRNGGQNVPLVPSGAGMVGIPGLGSQSSQPPAGHRSPGASASSRGAPHGVALPPVTTVSGSRPWLAWRPSGSGQVLYVKLPAPWSGGTSPTASVAVYLPPGYGTGNRRYPVVYEAPWPITLFQNGANIQGTLDALITSGTIPASIFVFASSGGGPYVDNECINSADGRENFDDYLSRT
ncbi:MAG: esterase family protein, partial [Chloroflexota bacterium]|nr:esterase family protein [Chloroflexota bacterium]